MYDTDLLEAVEQHGSTVVVVVDRVTDRACTEQQEAAQTCPGEYHETDVNPRLRRYPLAPHAVLALIGPSGGPDDRVRPSTAQLSGFAAQTPRQVVDLRFDAAGRVTGLAEPWHP